MLLAAAELDARNRGLASPSPSSISPDAATEGDRLRIMEGQFCLWALVCWSSSLPSGECGWMTRGGGWCWCC